MSNRPVFDTDSAQVRGFIVLSYAHSGKVRAHECEAAEQAEELLDRELLKSYNEFVRVAAYDKHGAYIHVDEYRG